MKLVQNSLILLILSTICSVSYSQEFKLIPSINSENGYFGKAVSIHSDWAFISDGDERVFVFKRCGKNWIERQILEVEGNPSSVSWKSTFGISIAISENYAIIGDTYRYVEPITSPVNGAAFIFKLNGDEWELQTRITAPGTIWDRGRLFGWSVAISDSFAVVGKPVDGNSAHIYKRIDENWEFYSTVSHDYRTGESVAISNNYLAIGSVGGGLFNQGQGSVHTYNYDGENWIHQVDLKASDGSNDDSFGETLSLSGRFLIAGDTKAQNNVGVKTGAAYIFERTGNDWIEKQKLMPSDGSANSLFGTSVAISNDIAIVGAPGEDRDGNSNGAVYVFYRDSTEWIEKYKVLASDGSANHEFGKSVSVFDENAIVNSWWDNATNSMSGSAYIYSFGTPDTSNIRLMIDSFQMSEQIIVGDSTNLNWKIENINTLPLETTDFIEVIYISSDTIWDINDPVLFSNTSSLNLQPSESIKRSAIFVIPGVPEKRHHFIIRSFILCDDSELFVPLVSKSFIPNFNILTIGESILDSIKSDENIYYKIEVPDSLIGQTLNIFFEADSNINESEMYLCLDTIPTEYEYVYKSVIIDGRKKIVISGLNEGIYYLLVHGNKFSGSQPIKISTEIPPFKISSFEPSEGGNTGRITTKISGTQFTPNMSVYLAKENLTIHSKEIIFIDPTTIFVRFDLTGQLLGEYDFHFQKTNKISASEPNGFKIVQGVPENLITRLNCVSVSRFGGIETIQFTYENAGNTDIEDKTAIITSQGESILSFTPDDFSENSKKLFIYLQKPDVPLGVLRPGELHTIEVYTKILDDQYLFKLSVAK